MAKQEVRTATDWRIVWQAWPVDEKGKRIGETVEAPTEAEAKAKVKTGKLKGHKRDGEQGSG